MNLPLRIARKYFFSKKVNSVVNLISGVSLVGVSVGSAALIILLSVFNGFENLVISLYNAFDSDYKVELKEGKYFEVHDSIITHIASWDEVAMTTPVIEENVMALYDEHQSIATIKGIKPDYLITTGLDSATVYAGNSTLQKGAQAFALVGSGIASKLRLNVYNQFALLELYMPKDKNIILNYAKAFNKRRIRPAGVFSIQKEFDDQYIVLPYAFAEDLTEKKQQATSIEINVKTSVTRDMAPEIAAVFGSDFVVKNRQEQHSFIHKILNSEKLAVYLILSFVLLIAAFNLVGTLTMLAIEKKKDVAILTSMGMTQRHLQRVFTLHGLIMAFTGATVGIGLGTLLCYIQMQYGIITIPGATFVASAYPVAFNGTDHLAVFATVMAIGFLASWLPARAMSRKVDLRELQVR